MRKLSSLLLAFAAWCSYLSAPHTAHANQQLTLLIHPYLPAPEIYKRFAPLTDTLNKATGKKITIKISKDYQRHIDAIGQDQTDLAYMGPAAYVEMTRKYGKKPLLACQEVNGKPYLHGMIITKADSPIMSLAELSGKRFAFVDPESTMYFVPRFMLQEAGVGIKQLARADFLKSHPNVALAVINGYYEAGAVKDEVFYAYQKRGLKMLATTPPVREHIFVASSQLSETLVSTVRKALHDVHDPQILTSILPSLTGLVAVTDQDYDSLRQMMQALSLADK